MWTSYAQYARWGIALVRTDPDAPRHRGISCMAVDMTAPGVEVRPLVTMTGEAEFNEVFLDEVFVPDDQLIGEVHQGWRVANTTLAHERGTTFPFKEQVVHEVYLGQLLDLAATTGSLDDPLVADQLVDAYVKLRVLRLHNWRTMTRLARGEEPGPGVVAGEAGLDRHDPVPVRRRPGRGRRRRPAVGVGRRRTRTAAVGSGSGSGARPRSIAGGTSEVQRTIIGERILGLPR